MWFDLLTRNLLADWPVSGLRRYDSSGQFGHYSARAASEGLNFAFDDFRCGREAPIPGRVD